MSKKAYLLEIIGLILIVLPYFFNQYSILRILSIILGASLLLSTLFLNKKNNIFKIFIFFILLIIILFSIDFLLVRYQKRIPIFSLEVKSSAKVSTYNSLFYRVYDCNEKITFDFMYKKNYICEDILPEENINSLLSQIVNNYSDYRNKFVNVNGKISSISGSTSIAMQSFETSENSINGQVNFSNNITLIIMNNKNLENFEDLKIYDTLNVIGRISKIKNNGQNKEIIMEDAKIINRNNFLDYEINVIQNKSCDTDLKLLSKTDVYTYYTKCLDSIYVKYDSENIYDLGYVLTDKRMTYEKLIENKEKEENDQAELYSFSEFNLIKCKNSNNIILGNKKLDLETNYCENFTKIEENENFEEI